MFFLKDVSKFKLLIDDEIPSIQLEGLISNSALMFEQSNTEYCGLGARDLNSAEVTFLIVLGTLKPFALASKNIKIAKSYQEQDLYPQ